MAQEQSAESTLTCGVQEVVQGGHHCCRPRLQKQHFWFRPQADKHVCTVHATVQPFMPAASNLITPTHTYLFNIRLSCLDSCCHVQHSPVPASSAQTADFPFGRLA